MPPRGRKKERVIALYEHIVEIRTVDECQRFFEDLCAPTELQAIEQRFSVARMLHEGRGYAEILKESGASSATVSRVNRALNYSTGGMKELMERMDEKRGNARPREDEE